MLIFKKNLRKNAVWAGKNLIFLKIFAILETKRTKSCI